MAFFRLVITLKLGKFGAWLQLYWTEMIATRLAWRLGYPDLLELFLWLVVLWWFVPVLRGFDLFQMFGLAALIELHAFRNTAWAWCRLRSCIHRWEVTILCGHLVIDEYVWWSVRLESQSLAQSLYWHACQLLLVLELTIDRVFFQSRISQLFLHHLMPQYFLHVLFYFE